MKNGRLAVLSVLICLLVAPVLVLAHHAATQYETDKLVTLKGTITEFKFVNPHPHLYFEVKDAAGNVEMWIAESGAPPSRWYNSGWRANALKFGDVITITGGPRKDGQKMMRIRKIVGPSGQQWTEGAAAE
jgi:Family of unknown function (DUF6152)